MNFKTILERADEILVKVLVMLGLLKPITERLDELEKNVVVIQTTLNGIEKTLAVIEKAVIESPATSLVLTFGKPIQQ